MKQREPSRKQAAYPVAGIAALVAALLCLCLAASPASAAFEQVGCFAGAPVKAGGPASEACKPVAEEKFSEEVQLGGVGGMAVNYTGAGEIAGKAVPAGTVYAAINAGSGPRVAMYEPKVGGGLEFVESWRVTGFVEPYERCGPLLGVDGEGKAEHPCTPQANSITGSGRVDVDVDETTGNVYAYSGTNVVGNNAIIEYKPDGSEEITRFGEIAPSDKTTAETPSQIHTSPFPGAIAVNGAGEVYVFDQTPSDSYYHRLMRFQPKVAGKYDEYEYAGTATDLGTGFNGEVSKLKLIEPVVDAAGHLYVTSGENKIEELDPAQPKASPLCSFEYGPGGITGITVDPLSGEVFFNSYKPPKRVRRLGPCDEASGEFTELDPEPEAIEIAPERDDLWGLAFDPLRQTEASRPVGVLYGGAPRSKPLSGPGEPDQSSLGYIFTHPKELPPSVEAESVAHVSPSGALLRAQIDPNGFATRYRFQYLSAAEYEANPPGERFAGAEEAPPSGATLPGAPVPNSVSAAINGLEADTEYRFRVLATSFCSKEKEEKEEECETPGEAVAFRTFPEETAGLADHRAYELVSPAQKNGGQVFPAYPGIGTCGGCKPGIVGSGRFPMQSSPEGNTVAYEGTPFAPGEGAARENSYISRRDPAKGWQTVNPTPALSKSGGGKGYKAFSTDFSRGVLEQTDPQLTPDAPSGYANLYSQPSAEPLALEPLIGAGAPNRAAGALNLKYAGASTDLSRVFFAANDALTEETPFAPAAKDGGASKFDLYEWHEGALALVNVLPGNTETEAGASFGAGSANAISADGSRAFWSDEAGHVYLREDAEATTAIPDPGKFLAAATDGSKVLLSNGHIYDLEEEATTDLTEGKGGFQGVAGQSEDLSHVYFLDTEVLDEAPNGEGEAAVGGKFNLYAWSEGTTRFVARLEAKDNSNSNAGDWQALPSQRTAEASPQGRYLAFLSKARLSGYDNTGPCEVILSGPPTVYGPGPCPEAFLYDSASDELTCASCNPANTRPLGESVLRLIENAGSWSPQPRYLTDAGRLYFDSRDSLSPTDTNEGVEDVYEFEPSGVGTCERESGCVSLISAGHEAVDSNLLAVDETGKNVFFTSRDQLVQKDKDDLLDLYDAREGGGIPGETETARSECQGEACQPPVSAPNDSTPGSSSFEGPGNVVEKKAKKHKKKQAKKRRKHAHKRAAKHNRGGGR